MSSKHISDMARAGELPRNGNGKYPIREAVRSYVTWLRNQYRRNTKGALADRIQNAKANEIELKTAMRSGEVIELDEALTRVAIWAGRIKSDLLGLAVRLSDDPKQRALIEKEINRLLENWAALAAGSGGSDEEDADEG